MEMLRRQKGNSKLVSSAASPSHSIPIHPVAVWDIFVVKVFFKRLTPACGRDFPLYCCNGVLYRDVLHSKANSTVFIIQLT